ncbi:MAG: menaquinone-dependent protoporphyrinogen IX dehydrogenase [Halobacteria archaeon]|nr:menaquinone-dependent protoporphyrinogen IX dehydrogenase [Halobacteria archaeon]
MSEILVIYGTSEGQTEKIAKRISEVITDKGHDVERVYAKETPPGLAFKDYDGVIVGASIHVGKFQDYVHDLVERNSDLLNDKLSAFFSVSLTAAGDEPDDEKQAREYVDTFVKETGWHPDMIGIFAGALKYSEYGFIKRSMMKKIAKKAGWETDTSRDYEYTDWEDVMDFAESFADAVERVDSPENRSEDQ